MLLYLNISIHDFLIAGGVILFIISARDLVGGGRDDLVGQEDLFAVVPLGVPLLAGPAVLTTSLIIFNSFGFFYVLIPLLLNLLIAGMIFKYSLTILRFVSRRWVEAISKVFFLLLASIAIMFIRTGLQGLYPPQSGSGSVPAPIGFFACRSRDGEIGLSGRRTCREEALARPHFTVILFVRDIT